MTFNELAKQWENEKNIERSIAIGDEIKRLLNDKPATKVMDFGSGIGLVSFYLKDFFKEITLVDLEEAMIKEASKRIEENKFDNIKVFHGNVLTLDENDKFDVIYAPMVLHHVANYREVLGKFKMLLNNGGKLIVIDMLKDNGQFHKLTSMASPFDGFEPSEMKKHLEEAKFDCVSEPVEFFKGSKEKNGNTAHYRLFSILAAIKE